MPGTNNFLQFNPTAANQDTDAQYAAEALLTGGIPTNAIMSSQLGNKLFYQLTTWVAAMAAMMAAKGYNVSDSVLVNLQTTLANIVTQVDLYQGAPNQVQVVGSGSLTNSL